MNKRQYEEEISKLAGMIQDLVDMGEALFREIKSVNRQVENLPELSDIE